MQSRDLQGLTSAVSIYDCYLLAGVPHLEKLSWNAREARRRRKRGKAALSL